MSEVRDDQNSSKHRFPLVPVILMRLLVRLL
jgi:hypothetical protein